VRRLDDPTGEQQSVPKHLLDLAFWIVIEAHSYAIAINAKGWRQRRSVYRPLAVGIGVIAAYLAIVVHASFSLRRKIGAAAWRTIHRLTFLLFVLAAGHGLLAGTDARVPWMIATYATTTSVAVLLVIHRLLPTPGEAMRSPRPVR
jgi:predicted ferric reductase